MYRITLLFTSLAIFTIIFFIGQYSGFQQGYASSLPDPAFPILDVAENFPFIGSVLNRYALMLLLLLLCVFVLNFESDESIPVLKALCYLATLASCVSILNYKHPVLEKSLEFPYPYHTILITSFVADALVAGIFLTLLGFTFVDVYKHLR